MNEMILIFLGVVTAEAGTDWALTWLAPESLRIAGFAEFETSLLPHLASILVLWTIIGFYVRFVTPKIWRERYEKKRKMRFIRNAFFICLALDFVVASYLYFSPLIEGVPAVQEPDIVTLLFALLIRGTLVLGFFWTPILAIWVVVYRRRRIPPPRRRKVNRDVQKATDN